MTDTERDGPPGDESAVAEESGELADVQLDVRDVTAVVDDYAAAILDASGCIVSWTDAARRIMGYDGDEIVGSHYRVLFPAPEREEKRPERRLERARADGRAAGRDWRVRRDGERRWVEELLLPVCVDSGGVGVDAVADDSPDGYGWVVHDRTADHEREDELRTEQAFTESVLDAQPDILYAYDVDGELRDWNDRLEDVTGYDVDDLATLGPLELIAPTDRDRIAAAIDRVLEDGDRVTADGHLLTNDGERLPYEFNSAPITDDEGDVLGFTGIGRDVSERKERERQLREEQAFLESVFEAQPDIVYAFDTTRGYRKWNDRVPTVTGYTETELSEMDPLEFVAPEYRERIDAAIDRVLGSGDRVAVEAELVTKDGDRIPYEFNSTRITNGDGTVHGFIGIGRDISDRKEREREFERLDRLNDAIRAIDESTVSAESREEIESVAVERLAETALYRFAAIGRTESTGDRPVLEAWAGEGIDECGLEAVLDSFVAPDGPSVEKRSVRAYTNLRERDVDAWRADAREYGYGAVAVVPLVASDRELGVIVVGAGESSPFTDRELEVLEEFGGTVGHASHAMTLRRLLYTDTVVELEFESTDRGDILVDLSHLAECRLAVDHVLPMTDDAFVYYVTASEADPDRLREATRGHDAITDARSVDVDGEESRWEFVVGETTIAGLLAEHGGRIRSKVVDDGVSTDIVQVSPDADVRGLVDAVTSVYPETTLVSKHTVDRPVRTRGDFRQIVETQFTDRQQAALEAAYYGGYFEWPRRRSDAGDLAAQLGIARQTFHQHLRVAQRKLLAAFFDGDPR
ncbi:PAS domain S-box protein [Natronobacterium gregoryi]|uniref:histidine kinase n=2 Tax=Natronobacterium gregoryi TaxID=44930 RepID=L0AGJ7_NATGS|nr:PAS domain S-box protein [Natronobacterium gregoryi]AFZ72185.1 PAS domain S-box [Natronobacterium gregoryi SP2]ELY63039.1 PAS/PAC sensor protein [Natronobacterium gregoryi SP2]PLK20131.1 PAS domain S-box protein [Natronobacterium gregoryi SP2]SFJ32566.1 PAS domain S-box-containing protein [Natronobacterium gregoryi]